MEKNNLITPNESKRSGSKIISSLIWIAVTVAFALGTFFFTNNYLFRQPVSGTSMLPTIQDEEVVLVFRTKNPNYDDIIVFDNAEIGKRLIKRVIGKPGDEIKSVYDAENLIFHIYRNGELVDEKHINEPMVATGGWSEKTFVVPENHYFFLGDNRNHSWDSSEGLLAEKQTIEGVAFLLIGKNGSIRILS